MADENTAPTLAGRLVRATTLLQPIAALVSRLVVGEAFILTGLGKWRNLDGPTALFTQIGSRRPGERRVIAHVGARRGACLMLGLGTRVFSLLLSRRWSWR